MSDIKSDLGSKSRLKMVSLSKGAPSLDPTSAPQNLHRFHRGMGRDASAFNYKKKQKNKKTLNKTKKVSEKLVIPFKGFELLALPNSCLHLLDGRSGLKTSNFMELFLCKSHPVTPGDIAICVWLSTQ